MTKIGKTFTIDQDIFNWLVEHAEAKGKESIVCSQSCVAEDQAGIRTLAMPRLWCAE